MSIYQSMQINQTPKTQKYNFDKKEKLTGKLSGEIGNEDFNTVILSEQHWTPIFLHLCKTLLG